MGVTTTYVGELDSSWPLFLVGLGEAEQILHLGAGAAIGSATIGLLLFIWAWYQRVVLERVGPQEITPMSAVPWWVALREAIYLQLLWALYRAFVTPLTGNRIGAASISLALIALSWVSDPRRRHDLLSPRAHLVVQDWLFALFTAYLSLTVRALWFLVVMHTLWAWSSGQVLARLTGASALPSILRSSGR
jgi:hypothetical protein